MYVCVFVSVCVCMRACVCVRVCAYVMLTEAAHEVQARMLTYADVCYMLYADVC